MADINLLVLDVDGTLTDGAIIYSGKDSETKIFNVKDGLVLHALTKLGIKVIFLTGRESGAVKRRAADLGAIAIQGISNKLSVLCDLLKECNIEPECCVYIGDDLNDFAAMKICGFKACPADAAPEIKEICNYISTFSGGHGAVRDIVEYILKQNRMYNQLLKIYGISSNR